MKDPITRIVANNVYMNEAIYVVRLSGRIKVYKFTAKRRKMLVRLKNCELVWWRECRNTFLELRRK